MISSYSEILLGTVIEMSNSDSWESAVLEWNVVDVKEDETSNSSCICGKEGIRYLFTIKNRVNGNILFPIGSSCIKKFGRDDLNEITSIKEKLFRLFHAVKENEFISLDSEFFSRKLLEHLYEEGAFINTKYNKFNGKNDYEFMLKMFNSRKGPTIKQKSKIKAIIVVSIKPFLVRQLEGKTV